MALPKIYAPLETVEIGGEQITLRALTRAEQFQVQKAVKADIPEDEQEILVVSLATDVPLDEARDWYGATPTWAVQELLEEIYRMNKLGEEARAEAQKSG